MAMPKMTTVYQKRHSEYVVTLKQKKTLPMAMITIPNVSDFFVERPRVVVTTGLAMRLTVKISPIHEKRSPMASVSS